MEEFDLAAAVWYSTAKHYKSSYLAWSSYIGVLCRQDKYSEARATYMDIISKTLDWPEAIFDGWISFENLYGTLEDLQYCLDKVARAQFRVNTKRAKEAEKAASKADAPLIATAQQQALMSVSGSHTVSTSVMDVDVSDITENGKKRKPEIQNDVPTKKIKTGECLPSKLIHITLLTMSNS